MSRGIQILLVTLVSVVLQGGRAHADSFDVRMTGRAATTISMGKITIGDLAEVTAATPTHDDAAIAIRKIVVREGVTPGMSVAVRADELLRTLERAGVNLATVGYSLPRTMSVERAGRAPQQNEILAALQALLANQGRSAAELREVAVDGEALIAIDPVTVRAVTLTSPNPGHLSAEVTATDSEGISQRFKVRAKVEEWRELPVAARSLTRGTVVSEEDLQMARLNIAALPGDVIPRVESIVGLQASKDISFGEVIRKSRMVIPPVVSAGSRVTMMYRSGALELTASGTALESAPPGGEVKVRSEMSKRIISGVAQDDGMVLVSR